MSRPKTGYHYYFWYRARRGDSLYKIARRNRTTVRRIRRANNLGNSSLIRVGQRLKIPSRRLTASSAPPSSKRSPSSANREFHKVRRGESLSKIARLYGLNLAQLKALNNIQGAPLIHPGQKLRVKKQPAAAAGKAYHLVRRGDTLIGIAKKYRISLPKLMKANSMGLKSVLLPEPA